MTSTSTDSLIFDLDGTLWDASETCANAWTELLQDLNISEYTIDAAAIRAVSGLSVHKVFKEHFTFIPEDRRAELLEAYKPMELKYMKEFGGRLYPEVREVLQKLSESYKLFVVSNCLSGYIENFMQFHGLKDVFIDFECSGNTGQPKSENIKMIIQRNALQNPIYIGDTIWDFEAATAADIPFIYAAYGFGTVENAEQRVDHFEDLTFLLK
ncbi:MAG: HAD family hydrolase [Daejeonella sp.]|uniref:HAD family hydrolase n=1 Tax=Daejeonella sp. JGW-45 TaxID=3034148 RepID=UPI0023EC906B|nr:HAD family hydrolase [Daejeonella sp. JGW-45]